MPSGGPSFTFTVAGRRRQFAPPAAPDPNTVRISTDNFREVEKNLEMPSFDKKFSGVSSKNISFTATVLHSIGIQLIAV